MILFNLCAIVMFITYLNLLNKKIKGGYDRYHHLSKDGKMFLLII